MPFFRCKYKDKYGNLIEKDIFAGKLDEILKFLKNQRCEVVSVREKKLSLLDRIRRIRGASKLKLSLFSRQMAVMLGGGVGIVNALNSISEYEEDLAFKAALKDVLNKVYMGYKFSSALQAHAIYFSDFFVSLVRVGEISGSLPYAFGKIADYYERDTRWINSLKAASFYPATILLTGIGIFIFLTFYFVPAFAKVYAKINMPLPFLTKLIVGSISFIVRPLNLLIMISVAVAFFLLIISYFKTPVGKKKLDDFMLNVPVFGTVINKVIIIRFLIGIEVLYNSGVALLDAILEVKKNMENTVYGEILGTVEDDIKQGVTFSASLSAHKNIPKVVSSMICMGEESGRLNLSFKNLVKIYEDDVQYAIDGMVSIVEPLAIVLLAVVIGAVIVALFLPLYNLLGGI